MPYQIDGLSPFARQSTEIDTIASVAMAGGVMPVSVWPSGGDLSALARLLYIHLSTSRLVRVISHNLLHPPDYPCIAAPPLLQRERA